MAMALGLACGSGFTKVDCLGLLWTIVLGKRVGQTNVLYERVGRTCWTIALDKQVFGGDSTLFTCCTCA